MVVLGGALKARPELSRLLSLAHVRSGDRQVDSSVMYAMADFAESGTMRYDPNRGRRNDRVIYGRAQTMLDRNRQRLLPKDLAESH